MSFLLDALRELVHRHPTEPKVLLVPSLQAGVALRTAAARAGLRLFDLEALTPWALAQQLARPDLDAAGQTICPDGAMPFLLAEALRRTGEPLARVRPTHQLARDVAAQRAGAPRVEALVPIVAAYEALLEELGLLDATDVFRIAQAALVDRPPPVMAVLDEVTLTGGAAAFVAALAARAPAAYRVGHAAEGVEPPPHVAAYRLGHLPRLPERPRVHPAGLLYTEIKPEAVRDAVDVLSGVTATAEVDAVLERILAEGEPLDEVEVAYPPHAPHPALFERAALRLGLPLTLGAGRPVDTTPPGALLLGWLRWIEDGLRVGPLRALVRSGLLRLDPAHDGLTNTEAGRLLGTLRAEARTDPRVAAARADLLHTEAARRRARGLDAERTEREAAAWTALEGLLRRLLDAVPGQALAAPAALARAGLDLLERHVPLDLVALRAKQDGREDETDAERAYGRLRDHLAALAALDALPPAPPGPTVRLLADQLRRLYVGARAPRPGHLHVTPLFSAGYACRRRLFVVGLEADALAAPSPAPWQQEAEEGLLWLGLRALGHATGRVTLSHSRLRGGEEEVAPSLLVLRVQRLRGEVPRPRPLVAAPPLTPLEAGILAGQVLAESRMQDEFVGRYVLAARGARAARLRRTVRGPHNGWLTNLEDDLLRTLDPLNVAGALAPTRLERLATCALRYLFRDVLELPVADDRPDDGRWLDPARRGAVVHDVLRRFVERRWRGQPLEPEALYALLDEALAEEERLLPPDSPAVRRAEARALRRNLEAFLAAESLHGGRYEPLAVELGFGLGPGEVPDRPPGHPQDHVGALELRLPDLPPLRLRGRVDRVDRITSGPHAGRVAVWDYKTGRADDLADRHHKLFQKARVLQWALYALALREAFDWDVAEAGYLFLGDREGGLRKAYAPPDPEHLAAVIAEPVGRARQGDFTPSPGEETCSHCDFARTCGPHEQHRAALASLPPTSAVLAT